MSPAPLLLVLGLQTAAGPRTVLVDGATLTDLGAAWVVPAKKGWFRVDRASADFRAASWAGPVAVAAGTPARGFLPLHDGDCEMSSSEDVDFLSERLVSLTDASGGYCGGAHPWADLDHANTPLAGLVRPAVAPETDPDAVPPEPVDPVLVRWFGAAAAATLVADAEASLTGHPADEVDCYADGVNRPTWGLVHEAGGWRVQGYLHYSYEACRGSEWPFPTHLAVPAKLGLRAGAALPAPADAVDWVAAPGADWRVDVRADAVVLVVGGAEQARLPVAGARVIETEWATGAANVARWRTDAAAAARVPVAPGPTLQVATSLRGGGYATWAASPAGLSFLGDGVAADAWWVNVAAARPSYTVDMDGGPVEEALVVSRPDAPPGTVFPDREPEVIARERGRTVTIEAVSATAVDIEVTTQPPPDAPGEAGPTAQRRRVPLAAGSTWGDALDGAGVPLAGDPPAPRLRAATADGRLVVTCVPGAIEARLDGALVGRVRLSSEPPSGEEPPPDVAPGAPEPPACAVIPTPAR